MSPARPQVVFLSSIDWNTAWQRHQIFAAQFARAGYEVFFVENTGFRNPRLSDAPRIWARLRNLARLHSAEGVNAVPAGLKVLPPRVAPPTHAALRWINAGWLLPRLARELAEAGFRPGALLFCYVPTASTLRLIELLRPSTVVYDCASNFRGHPDAPEDFLRLEARLLRHAALVVTDSDYLYEQKKTEHPSVVQIHQGVAPEFFQASPPSIGWDKICYYGTWSVATDGLYLEALESAGFDVTISGFLKTSAPAGIRALAPADRDRLVERLERFDVFTMPYVIDSFTLGVVPAKLYECLAMGRPVLASPLPSIKPLAGLIHISGSPDEWVSIVRNLPKTETPELRAQRIALAREHTHEKEFARLLQAVEAAENRPRSTAAEETAPLTGAFLRGFGWIGALYTGARALTLAGQVLAGRLLGPVEYGKANLIIAMAAFLQVLPMLGFPTALAKLPAEEPDDARRGRLISTALSAFAIWIFPCAAVALALPSSLARLGIAVPAGLWSYTAALAFLTAFYTVAASPLLGLRRFAERGAAELVYGLCVPAALIGFYATGRHDFRAMIWPLCIALTLASAFALWPARHDLRPCLDREPLQRVLGYAALASMNLLTTACVVAPGRLILHRRFEAFDVGVFSAYFTSSAQLSLALLTVAGAVIVPLASRPADQARAWREFRRWRVSAAAAAFVIFAGVSTLGIALFGRQYPLDPAWILAFAAAATLILVHGVAAALYAARDLGGLRVSVAGALVAAGGNVALSLILIPRWGIMGAAAALVGGYVLGLGCYAAIGPEMVESTQP